MLCFQNDGDYGYNTATSDENRGNTSFEDDRLSIEELQFPTSNTRTSQSPEVSTEQRDPSSLKTDRAEKRLLDQAAETFKGRAIIPPVTDTPLSMDNTDKPAYNTGERRKLKHTVNTYVPSSKGGLV